MAVLLGEGSELRYLAPTAYLRTPTPIGFSQTHAKPILTGDTCVTRYMSGSCNATRQQALDLGMAACLTTQRKAISTDHLSLSASLRARRSKRSRRCSICSSLLMMNTCAFLASFPIPIPIPSGRLYMGRRGRLRRLVPGMESPGFREAR